MSSTILSGVTGASTTPTPSPSITINDGPRFHNYSSFCEALLDQGVPTAPDPDISGIGVISAFVVSAYLTLGLVLIVYFLGLAEPELLNPVDTRIMRIKRRVNPPANIRLSITKAILALGDQQIVTGIAIMGAGFQGLRTGTISIYHYQVVLYLAWMSSSVHLSALTILGKFLTENPGLMGWRLTGMLVLLVMLLVGLVPTVSNVWGTSENIGLNDELSGWGVPAKCIWVFGDQLGTNPDAVIGYVILIISYLWKVGGLFKSARERYSTWVIVPVERTILRILSWSARNYISKQNFGYLLLYRLSLSVTLWILGVIEFGASFAASLWISVVGIAFGTMQVFVPRSDNLYWTESGESVWGFGQLVPLILLVQPVGAVMECISPGTSGEKAEAEVQEVIANQNGSGHQPQARLFDKHVCLLDILAHSNLTLTSSISSSDESPSRVTVKSTIYASALFKVLVWLLQAAILTTSVVALAFDYYTIGYTSAENWQNILYAVGSYIGGSMLSTLLMCSFSRLGRSRSKRTVEWMGSKMRQKEV